MNEDRDMAIRTDTNARCLLFYSGQTNMFPPRSTHKETTGWTFRKDSDRHDPETEERMRHVILL